jgi:hypothetical protein
MKRHSIFVIVILFLLNFYFNCGVITHKVKPWPDGKIPYTFSNNFSIADRMFIENCMDAWERDTNIDFYYYYGRDEDFYVLRILRDDDKEEPSSAATVGYCFEPIIIFGVLDRAVILHELGHVIGLSHEHQRPDRDKYIKVLYKNIDIDVYFCFKKRSKEEFLYDYTKFPYDYNSIMHYYEYSFSNNNKKVIISPIPTGNTTISKIDILKVNEIYKKPKNK